MNKVWDGKSGVYLIAEIGGNHEGDFEYAKSLTKLAIEGNPDAIKFQIYTGDSLVNKKVSPDRNQHFKKFELAKEQHIYLAEMCKEANVQYNASVWDMDALDWIDPYLNFYKIGSGDLTAYSVLEKIISRGKPMLISTGLSTLADIEKCVDFIYSKSADYRHKDMLGILQCTSMYPISPEDANLNVIKTYAKTFNATIGYSDHTEGTRALVTSVAMGAEILEFHFTDKREGKSFRDHKVSLTKEEVLQLSSDISMIKMLQGSFEKKPTNIELETLHTDTFRRAIYPNKNLEKGHIILKDDFVTLRPNEGIGAEYVDEIIGKKLIITKDKLSPFSWQDFE